MAMIEPRLKVALLLVSSLMPATHCGPGELPQDKLARVKKVVIYAYVGEKGRDTMRVEIETRRVVTDVVNEFRGLLTGEACGHPCGHNGRVILYDGKGVRLATAAYGIRSDCRCITFVFTGRRGSVSKTIPIGSYPYFAAFYDQMSNTVHGRIN